MTAFLELAGLRWKSRREKDPCKCLDHNVHGQTSSCNLELGASVLELNVLGDGDVAPVGNLDLAHNLGGGQKLRLGLVVY